MADPPRRISIGQPKPAENATDPKLVAVLEKLIGKIDKLTDKVKENTEEQDEANKESKKGAFGKLGRGLFDNTVGLIGMSTSMFTLGGILKDTLRNNDQLATSLAQLNTATTESSRSVRDAFDTGNIGFKQAIDTFKDSVSDSVAFLGGEVLRMSGFFKVLGVNNKAANLLMRRNIQLLGMSAEGAVNLADTLVSTAMKYGISIDKMVSVVNSLKDAMVKTTVELGPKQAANVQKLTAMIAAQGGEFADMAGELVKSFVVGTKGRDKAAAFGVMFERDDDFKVFQAKFERLIAELSRRGGLATGMQITSADFFEAQAAANQGTHADFLIAQHFIDVNGGHLRDLVTGQTENAVEAKGAMSIQQAMANATFGIQSKAVTVAEGMAAALHVAGGFLAHLVLIPTIVSLIQAIMTFNVAKAAAGGFGGMMPGGGAKAGGKFKGMGKFIKGAGWTAGIGYGVSDYLEHKDPLRATGIGLGAAGGAAAGAAIGTMFLPVIGTIIGGIAGGIAGGWGSTKIADSLSDKNKKDKSKAISFEERVSDAMEDMDKKVAARHADSIAKHEQDIELATRTNQMQEESLRLQKGTITDHRAEMSTGRRDPYIMEINNLLSMNILELSKLVSIGEQQVSQGDAVMAIAEDDDPGGFLQPNSQG